MGVLGVNHVAFRTANVPRLRKFYEELLGAESLDGDHQPLRAGAVLLVFFESGDNAISADPDEIAFDVDEAGYAATLANARHLGVLQGDPVDHTAWSRGFVLHDPDGRRIEITYEDRAVFWRN
jgi:catechol 2,3-dioxygenase-like lactoylglutathione lyase family enzyme